MSNMINSKLLGLLSNIDKDKLDNAQKIIQNISKEDLNALMNLIDKNINNKGN